MVQYFAIKARYPEHLLFYRMGDFYKLFEVSEVAAKALGIVPTKRGKHEGHDLPMCGVPVERSEDYLDRLILQDYKVAICEQIEDPEEVRRRGGKSVVRREVVRLVSPGTIDADPGAASVNAIVGLETCWPSQGQQIGRMSVGRSGRCRTDQSFNLLFFREL